ncbi:hypothetical protein Tco_0270952 [Tanacetum coccineum]
MKSRSRKKGNQVLKILSFISSSNTNSGKSEVPTAQSFSTASGQVTTASIEVATTTFSHDTICAYIATQQSGSQIKYEDITQIDDDDIENGHSNEYALLSMKDLEDSGFAQWHMTPTYPYLSQIRAICIEDMCHIGYGGGKILAKAHNDWLKKKQLTLLSNVPKQCSSKLVHTRPQNYNYRMILQERGGILIDSPQKEQEEVHTDKDVSEQVEHEVNEEVPESSGIYFPTASSKESSKLTSTPKWKRFPTKLQFLTVNTSYCNCYQSRGGLRYSQATVFKSNVVSSENIVEDFFGDSTHATRLNEVEADLRNMETTIQVSPTPTLRIHKDHLKNQIIGPIDTSSFKPRHKSKACDEQTALSIHNIIKRLIPDLYVMSIFRLSISKRTHKIITSICVLMN